MPSKNNLALYQKIARDKGGKCLSTKYNGSLSKLKFECSEGHTWETNAVNVSGKNRWCPFCAPNRKLSINDAINYANQFDGYCLSEKYTDSTTKLLWKCKFGHEWLATFTSTVNSKGWCPQCTGKFFSENIVRRIFEIATGFKFRKEKPKWLKYNKSFLELDGYCKELSLAFEHQGIQHYKETLFSTEEQFEKIKLRDNFKLEKCNSNGVQLIIVPDVFEKLGIDNLVDFILNELTNKNIPIKEKNIDIYMIMKTEKCQPSHDRTKEINDFVKSKGGECLDTYTHYNVKMIFKCAEGHEWCAKWNNIQFGSWCPFCYKIKRGIINV